MVATHTSDLVQLISNQLGWAPPLDDPRPWWKVRAAETAKLNRAIAKNPKLYTTRNLELAVSYMQQERITPRTTLAVIGFVEPALRLANQVEERPVEELVQAAINQEYARQGDGWRDWVSRLTNAFGPFRREVYEAWRTARST